MIFTITKKVKGTDSAVNKKFSCVISGSIKNASISSANEWIDLLSATADKISMPTIPNRTYSDNKIVTCTTLNDTEIYTDTTLTYNIKTNIVVKKLNKDASLNDKPNLLQTQMSGTVSTIANSIGQWLSDVLGATQADNNFAIISCIFELYLDEE